MKKESESREKQSTLGLSELHRERGGDLLHLTATHRSVRGEQLEEKRLKHWSCFQSCTEVWSTSWNVLEGLCERTETSESVTPLPAAPWVRCSRNISRKCSEREWQILKNTNISGWRGGATNVEDAKNENLTAESAASLPPGGKHKDKAVKPEDLPLLLHMCPDCPNLPDVFQSSSLIN